MSPCWFAPTHPNYQEILKSYGMACMPLKLYRGWVINGTLNGGSDVDPHPHPFLLLWCRVWRKGSVMKITFTRSMQGIWTSSVVKAMKSLVFLLTSDRSHWHPWGIFEPSFYRWKFPISDGDITRDLRIIELLFASSAPCHPPVCGGRLQRIISLSFHMKCFKLSSWTSHGWLSQELSHWRRSNPNNKRSNCSVSKGRLHLGKMLSAMVKLFCKPSQMIKTNSQWKALWV